MQRPLNSLIRPNLLQPIPGKRRCSKMKGRAWGATLALVILVALPGGVVFAAGSGQDDSGDGEDWVVVGDDAGIRVAVGDGTSVVAWTVGVVGWTVQATQIIKSIDRFMYLIVVLILDCSLLCRKRSRQRALRIFSARSPKSMQVVATSRRS